MAVEGEGTGAVTGTNGDANGVGDWRVSFPGMPDELKSDAILGRYKDPVSAFKGVVEAQRFAGSAIAIPKPDAPETEWDEKVFGRLAPKSIEDYQFGALPEGLKADEAMDSWFKTAAFEAKMPPILANRIRDRYNQFVGKIQADHQKEEEAQRTALKNEWGVAYDEKVALANKAGSDAFKALMHSVGLNAHPVVLKELAAMAASRREDGGLGDQGRSAASSGRSKAVIKQEIDAVKEDPGFMGAPGTTRQQRETATAKYSALWEEWAAASA